MEEDFLRKVIRSSILSLQKKGELDEFEIPEISLEHPKEYIHGDTSTPISASIAKITGKEPFEIAQKISKEIKSHNISSIRESTVAKPIFNNFYFSKDFFIDNIKGILKNKNFGKNQNLKNKKVIIEYTDPNVLKEFHIGHLMSNSIGESLSRIFEFNGAKIRRANYQGDVGLHVAKAIWGKKNMTPPPVSDKIKDWGLAYQFGTKIVEDGSKKEIFEKGEKGAIIFKGEKYGLHTRVFVNSEGLPTYEAKELALAK